MSTDSTPVLNMLNTRYFILPGENRQPTAFPNTKALGNAWFVSAVDLVDDADAEIRAIMNFSPVKVAVVSKLFSEDLKGLTPHKDSSDIIRLDSYAPNALAYSYHSANPGLAVFSEIYYPKGWNAFVDGQPVPHFRADYVLRAMVLPAGDHKVTFRFEPKVYTVGEMISRISSILLIVFVLVMAGLEVSKALKARG